MNVRYRRDFSRTAVVIKPAAQARPRPCIPSGWPDDDSFPALQVLFGTRGRSRLNQQFPGFEVFDAKGDLISVNVQDRNQVSADPQSIARCEINFLQRHSQPPCPTAPIWRQSIIHGCGLYHARRRLAIGVSKVKHERLKINNREARIAIGGRSLSQPFARRRPIRFP
jgi:hypothetical protein